MMLADDLAYRAHRIGFEEVGPEPPHDRTISRDDSEQACFAAADDNVVRCKPLVAGVEPSVRSDIGRGIDVQPVECCRRGSASAPHSGSAPPIGGTASISSASVTDTGASDRSACP